METIKRPPRTDGIGLQSTVTLESVLWERVLWRFNPSDKAVDFFGLRRDTPFECWMWVEKGKDNPALARR